MKHFIRWIGFFLFMGLNGCSGDNPVDPGLEPVMPNHEEGDLVVDLPNGVKMAFVLIEPGTFMMGSPESENGYKTDEGPRHRVTLTKGFNLGKYEVTQAQWKSVMGTEPWMDTTWGANPNAIGDDFPTVTVTWFDIQEFLNRLNLLDSSVTYRLPTESEWEYACRADTPTSWSFGEIWDVTLNQDCLWYESNSDDLAHKVGLTKPNPWGLYDMHGNVSEVVDYWELGYTLEAQIDPPTASLPESTEEGSGIYYNPILFLRGGAFNSALSECRSGSRAFAGRASNFVYSQGVQDAGFRIVRELM